MRHRRDRNALARVDAMLAMQMEEAVATTFFRLESHCPSGRL
jgi:hypothetical protein